MARTYARLYVAIDSDPDFSDLSAEEQALYFRLLAASRLTMCGVADWRPAKLVRRFRGMTRERLEALALSLEQRRFIVIDRETEEVLVRSFVRHDGVLKSPNLVKAMIRDYHDIGSDLLKQVVAFEVRRGLREDPDAKGSHLIPEGFPDPDEYLPELFQEPLVEGFPDSSGNPSGNPSENPSAKGSLDLHHPATSNQQPLTSASADDDDFEQWWTTYPRKDGKGQARKAFRAALKKASIDELAEGVERYAATVARSERKFIAMPATWLNGERWLDEADGSPAGELMLDSYTFSDWLMADPMNMQGWRERWQERFGDRR